MSIDIASLSRKILLGERASLARGITLVESRRADHAKAAQELLQTLLPHTGKAVRLGISGVPGAGKSTTIDALGVHLTSLGHKVAVLAVDPSSTRTGGSILGDKTRMNRLATDANAFIRPSPSAGTLGGVAAKTRETMLLCEAAGYDVVIVETVGVGQSEVAVSGMVDFFLVLMAPGTGDDLQGIKRGILEIADMIAVNKADGDNLERARRAANDYRAALHILPPSSPSWSVPVITISGLTGGGLDEMWAQVKLYRDKTTATGELPKKRAEQQVRWMWTLFEDQLLTRFKSDPALVSQLPDIEGGVRATQTTPSMAVARMFEILGVKGI
jgi:LAO/AO transport system kinase